MKFVRFERGGRLGLAVEGSGGHFRGLMADHRNFPGDLAALVSQGLPALHQAGSVLVAGDAVDLDQLHVLPPLPQPGKIVCLGLNYVDHSLESGFKVPDYPTVFGRFSSSLIGHGAALIKPTVSDQFDYEGELVAVIGKGGRNISEASALDHVIGYSIFNDASVRDYQFKSPQWTVGKNFDGTGAFGPFFVTADSLPPGASGLKLVTRLNGAVVQEASTVDMVFGVAKTIAILSVPMTFEAGDILVMGTPGGVGFARKPQLWMKPGDICEVEIEGIGLLRNPIAAE